MPKDRFQNLRGTIDEKLAPERQERYERALYMHHIKVQNARFSGEKNPEFDYRGKSFGVENVFCIHHNYLKRSCNTHMFSHELTDPSNENATLSCGCVELYGGHINNMPPCNYTERDLKIDTEKGEVVIGFDCAKSVCPYFKPISVVLDIAKEQLKEIKESKK